MKKKKTIVFIFALLIVGVMALAFTGVIEETLGMIITLSLTVIFTSVTAIFAFKGDVKLIGVMMILFTVLGLGLLFLNIRNFVRGNNTSREHEFSLEVTPDDNEKMSMFSINDKNFYTYHLGRDILVKMSTGESYSLKDALFYGYITLDEIAAMSIRDESTKGYKLYYDGGTDSSSKDKYALIICENSNDVIFGSYNMTYDASICINDEG